MDPGWIYILFTVKDLYMYYLFRVLEGVWGPGRGAGLLLWAGQGDGLRGGGGRSRGDQCHVGKASKWKNNKQT